MAEGAGGPFRLVYSGKVRTLLIQWGARASAKGLAAELATALRQMDERLREDPAAWGELHHRLPHLGLRVGVGFAYRIQVHFALDEQRRIVYVTDVGLPANHPLAT